MTKKLTSKMTEFLTYASSATPGKGVLIAKTERRLAAQAVKKKYGWMITSPLPIFIIEEAGRAALGGDHD